MAMPGKQGSKQEEDPELPGSAALSRSVSQEDHTSADTDKKELKLKLTRKQWAIASAILIVLLGAGIYKNRSGPEPDQPALTSEKVELRKLNSKQLQAELQKLIFEKKFSSAEQLINYQDNAATPELRMLLVATYMNAGKQDDALRVLLNMEKRYPDNWRLARTIGDLYQTKGDTQQAQNYYKKSLDLLKKTDAKDLPVRNDEISLLEQRISQLEGQQ